MLILCHSFDFWKSILEIVKPKMNKMALFETKFIFDIQIIE